MSTADADTWRTAQREVERRLVSAGIETAPREARWLIEQASGLSGAALADVAEDEPGGLAASDLDAMVVRRCAGEPLQYVLGSWPFRSLELFVDRRVLIPRPETEVVAGVAIGEVDRLAGRAPTVPLKVVDLGTGSGAIGLSIAAECSGVAVWLTDRSADALAVATANLAGLGRRGSCVRTAGGDWFDALPDELHGEVMLAVSNPPYVADGEQLDAQVACWEPEQAVRSGATGTEDLLAIIEESRSWLHPEGSLVLELDPRQVGVVTAAASGGGARRVDVVKDLAGNDRCVVVRSSG